MALDSYFKLFVKKRHLSTNLVIHSTHLEGTLVYRECTGLKKRKITSLCHLKS